MAGAEIDLVEQILGPELAADWAAPEPSEAKLAPVSEEKNSGVARPRLRRRFRPRLPARPRGKAVGFAVTFVIGAAASLAVLAGVAAVAFNAQSGRVVSGVHVGSLDVSGLTRDQVIARLKATYAYIGEGKITVTTPSGEKTATYQQLGRTADIELMADEAMQVSHSGDAISDAVTMLRSAVGGKTIQVAVRIDPAAVATSVHQMSSANVLPVDAQAWVNAGTFGHSGSVLGSSIDENAISAAVVAKLTDPDASPDFHAGGAMVALQPRVTEADAQAAIADAQKMLVDVRLIFANSSSDPKTWTVSADTIINWIVFGTTNDGKYRPTADPTRMQAYLGGIAPQLGTAAVEPTIVFNSAGNPASVQGGSNGSTVDVPATAQALATYLDELAGGHQLLFAVTAVTTPVPPNLSATTLKNLVNIGSWTTTFYPDVSNGNGANIRMPAKYLNGQIVPPGKQFSFLSAVGPIDVAHGFAMGGVIENGKSDHTGAMGGGICSASTTVFNAAARAGLQIDERHAHFYYINRYPQGLDATVYSNGYQVWDMKWTNDTPNPIIIVSGSTYGSKSTITVQLWSLPINRQVTFSAPHKDNVNKASDSTVYTTTLAPGVENRSEYPDDGFDTSETRTVTDSTGNVIHKETWVSHYARVNGVLLVGAPASGGAEVPAPNDPTPAPAVLPPGSASAQAPRRRPSPQA
ncbi:MAG TPA: VanW family protein [Candidatus Limnocylindrales bacterium]